MYWISLGLLNRCPQFSNFTPQNREKSSVLKGLTQDGIKSYFYGNDCFEPKVAIISYLNLLKTVFGKPGQVLSLSGLLYLLRVHVNIISSSQAWLIIISDSKLPILSKRVWADSQQLVRPSRTDWVDMTYIVFSHRDRC